MDPVQLITLGGAAGMAIWVLNLLASGKFHTHSEVEGLQDDKSKLWEANTTLQTSLKEANASLSEILAILRTERQDPQ